MNITRVVGLCYRVTPSGDGWTDDVEPLETTNGLGLFQFSEGLLWVKLIGAGLGEVVNVKTVPVR